MRHITATLTLCGLALCAGCYEPVTNDDAGDIAFVHQATQAILGRRPRGSREVSALLAIAQNPAQGRAAVVDVLLDEPDFVEYWLPVLADSLMIQREGDFSVKQACLKNPDFLSGCSGAACVAKAQKLADHVLDDIPSTPAEDLDDPPDGVADPFNMNDALRAALLLDDLTVAVRPAIFSLAGSPVSNGLRNPTRLRDHYMISLFNRNTECVGCHSSTYSTTENYGNAWDRTATQGWDLEHKAFGTHREINPANGASLSCGSSTVEAVYLATCGLSGCHESDGERLVAPGKRLTARVPVLSDDSLDSIIRYGTGSMLGQNIVCVNHMVQFLRDELGGFDDIKEYLRADQFDLGDDVLPHEGPWGLDCGFNWEPDQYCGDPDQTYTFGGDEPSCTDVGNIAESVKDGLAALPDEPEGADQLHLARPDLPSTSTADVSVAILLASNLADDIVEELSAGRLTVPHGLSRSPEQAQALNIAVSHLAIERGGKTVLSLKNVLKKVVLSNMFNRHAPDSTTLPTAYGLPMYLHPWAAVDPTSGAVPDPANGDDANSQGDLIHRRSPNQLLWSLHKDLGWSAPSPFPSDTGSFFPTGDLMKQMGRFVSVDKPGRLTWSLDALALFESEIGLCGADPAPLAPGATSLTPKIPGMEDDFISTLVSKAYHGDLNTCLGNGNICLPPFVKGLALRLKDRLLQDPVLDTTVVNGRTESGALAALFDAELGSSGSLDTQVTSHDHVLVERALRQYCNALVLSPDYLLSSMPVVTTVTTAPTPDVCVAGEPCTAQEITDHYDAALCARGYTTPLCP